MQKNKIQVSIIDDNIDVCNILLDYFKKVRDITVCSISQDGESGLNDILKYQPDVILLDLIMPNLDGICVLKKLSSLKLKSKVIMLTAINHDSIAQESFSLGCCYYMLKPFKLSTLEERIRSIYNFSKNNNLEISEPSTTIENHVIKKLIDIGIPTNILGYQYIVDAIGILINTNVPVLTKDIYQFVANKNATTVACVESAMRNAIGQAAKQNSEEFAKTFTETNKKPTNSQFITKLSQSIKVGL